MDSLVYLGRILPSISCLHILCVNVAFLLICFQDVQFGDLDLYSEDAWMSVSVSFNPYQCDLSPLTVSY